MSIETSQDGTVIHRHTAASGRSGPVAVADEVLAEAREAHIVKHLGPVRSVFHELVSDKVHLDVQIIAPTEDRPYTYLVTSGMSDAVMTLPPGVEEEHGLVELCLALPADGSLGFDENGRAHDEASTWPLRLLKWLARVPHDYNTWVGLGHTIPNPDGAFADGTELNGAMLFLPLLADEEFHTLTLDDGRVVHYLGVYTLFQEETDYKLDQGLDELLELLALVGASELLQPHRPNSVLRGLPFEDVELPEPVLRDLIGDDLKAKRSVAAQLMDDEDYLFAMAAWHRIGLDHPDLLGTAYGQIGAAHCLLGFYHRAIELYEMALEHGADASMMQDNLEVARQAIERQRVGMEPSDAPISILAWAVLAAAALGVIAVVVAVLVGIVSAFT